MINLIFFFILISIAVLVFFQGFKDGRDDRDDWDMDRENRRNDKE